MSWFHIVMISDDVLARLIQFPKYWEAPYEAAGPRNPILEERPLLRALDAAARFIRRDFARHTDEGPLAEYLARSSLVGIGIGPATSRSRSLDVFPVVEGWQFGAFIYLATAPDKTPEPSGDNPDFAAFISKWPTTRDRPIEYPVNIVLGQYDEHVHPVGARAAAYVSTQGAPAILTPAHATRRASAGTPVAMHCPARSGICSLNVLKTAGPFVDAALLDDSCRCSVFHHPPVTTATTVPATIGASVHMCLPSLRIQGSMPSAPATVTQDCGPPAQFLSAVQPRNFLTDVAGSPGDSGSLILDQSGNIQAGNFLPGLSYAGGPLVGMYLGSTRVRARSGASVTMGYGVDLGYALTILGATLIAGLC